MTPHKQTKIHSENIKGNCYATAIACILDIEISEVPNIEVLFDVSDGNIWYMVLTEWLNHKRYEHNSDGNGDFYKNYDGYYIVSGKSPRGDFNHCVIYKNGKMVHDPHPSGDGILTEDYWEHLSKI